MNRRITAALATIGAEMATPIKELSTKGFIMSLLECLEGARFAILAYDDTARRDR